MTLQFTCFNHAWWWQNAETCSSCECSVNEVVLRLNRPWHNFVKYRICLTQGCFVTRGIRVDILPGGMEGKAGKHAAKYSGRNWPKVRRNVGPTYCMYYLLRIVWQYFISKILQSIPKIENLLSSEISLNFC